MAFDLIEPFGQRRTDAGFRMLAAMFYEAHRSADAKSLGPEDFLPVWQPPVERDPEQEAAALIRFFEKKVKR